jgi:hypothetical protein
VARALPGHREAVSKGGADSVLAPVDRLKIMPNRLACDTPTSMLSCVDQSGTGDAVHSQHASRRGAQADLAGFLISIGVIESQRGCIRRKLHQDDP